MTEMSGDEAATVARFEAGVPAPESWGADDGLREAIARALHHDWHPEEDWDAIPDSVLGYYRRLADATLAPPEVAALRAKAAAADRVEALVSAWTNMAQPQSWGTKLYAIRRALDVSDRTDRGRC